MKTTPYFERRLIECLEIKREWCERVLRNPLVTEVQSNGRVRFWDIIPEFNSRALRVVTLEDRETVLNAHFDRNFWKQYTKENPLSLNAAQKLQRDRHILGVDRVDYYYKNAEGSWLENWQEESLDEVK